MIKYFNSESFSGQNIICSNCGNIIGEDGDSARQLCKACRERLKEAEDEQQRNIHSKDKPEN